MIYAVENGDYAVTDHVPRRLDAPEDLVQSLRLLLNAAPAGLLSSAGRRGGRAAGQICCRTNCWHWGRRAVWDVPGVLVLGVRTADGSAVFRLWVREEEREVTVAL